MHVLRRLKIGLDRLDAEVFYGAGEELRRPKMGRSRVLYLLNWLDYVVFGFLDRIDTRTIFKNRGVPTRNGRVRSRAEKRLAGFFESQQINYEYEPSLVLAGKELSPDFYLPDHEVYVELWGLADSDRRYQRMMSLKKALYARHSIPVISIYPRHLSCLPKVFPRLLEKAKTANPCPRKEM